MNKITVSAPGKLMLSGEWAVLELGNPAIVTAIDKRILAEIEDSGNDFIIVTLEDFGIRDKKAVFDGKALNFEDVNEQEKEVLKFIRGGIEASLQYLGVCRPFKIRTWGELSQIKLEGISKKVGFGSSAAAVVASVAGVLAFNGHDISDKKIKDLIYKLSAIAHYYVQGKLGSAFDVAASVYGGVFVYKRFDPNWLIREIGAGRPIKEIAKSEWPGLYVEELKIPNDIELAVGWTKESASTSAMIKQLNSWRDSGNQEEYKKCFDNIAGLVRELVSEWKKGNKDRILELIRKNEILLRELGQKSGVNIETQDLKTLSEIANNCGAAGKLSGAGGGDCGISICFDRAISERVRVEWERAGLYLIGVNIDRNGVKQE